MSLETPYQRVQFSNSSGILSTRILQPCQFTSSTLCSTLLSPILLLKTVHVLIFCLIISVETSKRQAFVMIPCDVDSTYASSNYNSNLIIVQGTNSMLLTAR